MSRQLAEALQGLRTLQEAEAVVAGQAPPERVFSDRTGGPIQEDGFRHNRLGALASPRPAPLPEAPHAAPHVRLDADRGGRTPHLRPAAARASLRRLHPEGLRAPAPTRRSRAPWMRSTTRPSATQPQPRPRAPAIASSFRRLPSLLVNVHSWRLSTPGDTPAVTCRAAPAAAGPWRKRWPGRGSRILPNGIVVIALHLRHCNWSPISSKSAICRPHAQHSSFHAAASRSPRRRTQRASRATACAVDSGLGVLELGMTALGISPIRPLAATSHESPTGWLHLWARLPSC